MRKLAKGIENNMRKQAERQFSYMNQQQGNFNNQQKKRKEGEIHLRKTAPKKSTPKNDSSDFGEYVDYEEV